ncbi:hypothetical protein GJ688_05630 [Heliobacillus mobilis]|uniref:Nucleotidyltransferase n=1 Tax=Heliobacterium mobile TaxID=28064 RepID=A0A6I3SHX5_HELMO|nr:nucleotidyltransferase domain-containing protein [Heliobacterium mobile]MTV48464.1 hypothetical protein [Heliobacterium mobile]
MLETIEGRKILLSARVGSPNYNLHDSTSDQDWKYLLLPTFDDLYGQKFFSSAQTSPEVDYTVHDIRRFAELILKGNPYFLEILFSQEVVVHPQHVELGQKLLSRKEALAQLNRPGLFRNCIGTVKEKLKNLRKGTSTTAHLVREFGYDTKEALHAYRLLDLLRRFVAYGWDFQKALWYEGETRRRMFEIKKGMVAHADIDQVLLVKLQAAEELSSVYAAYPVDQVTSRWLRQTVREQVRKGLSEELLPSAKD